MHDSAGYKQVLQQKNSLFQLFRKLGTGEK